MLPLFTGNGADRVSRSKPLRLLAVGVVAAGALIGCGEDTPFKTQRAPVLETVVSGDRVVPQNPNGDFAALPTAGRIRIRVQADWSTNIAVALDGADISLREGRPETDPWYESVAKVVPAPSRNLFWEIVINLPPLKRVSVAPIVVEVRDQTYLKTPPPVEQRPPLTVRLSNFADPARIPLASDFFNEAQGDNTKQDGRAKSQVITKGIVLAGWLWQDGDTAPTRNDSGEADVIRANESEDYHYDIWLDNDFITRNYDTPALLKPVRDAIVKGARSRLIDLRPGRDIPLVNLGHATAASFLWPGNGGLFTVELNAWHIADRGRPPAGWAGTDPSDPAKDGNAWPFQPRRPLGVNPGDPDLSPGQYVIISGTLWQDTSHADNSPVGQFRQCWDDHLPGHGGWLEIHPVDSIRRVDAPTPRKQTDMINVCSPAMRDITTVLAPRVNLGETISPDLVLRCQRIIDKRFTPHTSFSVGESLTSDQPAKLRVTLITLIDTMAQVVYITWYEKPDANHPPPDPADPCVDWTPG
ncbi:hypothetical protein [Actinoplanes sp. NPDC049599]|uniref:hypothetical protein n=1 Tax=Actinoplanes sp. NPDC049599 TaxID=3363903 RepID=UPI0037A87696